MHLERLVKQADVLKTMDIPPHFRMEGWVYILSNPCMPNILKIGMTTNSPNIRARELSSATGVPAPFKVEAAFYSHEPLEAEKDVHERLSDCRVSDSREFFELDVKEAIHVCSLCCEGMVGEKVESLAVIHDLITFENLDDLNLTALYDDIGISIFGDNLAAAERLIRIGADTLFNIRKKHDVVIVIDGGKAIAIEPDDVQAIRKFEEEQRALINELEANGIYGPQQPVEF